MRVLVADDHPLFRDGIISLLQAVGFTVISQVGDGQAAVAETLRLKPDLVLMDIRMPGMNGLEALRLIKQRSPMTQIVMLTVSDDDNDLLTAMQEGAHGYLLKNLSGEEFLLNLNGLGRGELALSRQMATRLIRGKIIKSEKKFQPSLIMTEREVEVLQQLALGMSNKSIAQEMSISENTVKYYIKKIFEKLDVQNRTEAVYHAAKAGIINNIP